MKVRIALLQLLPEKDVKQQFDKGVAACRKAKEMGADIALFPEMWSSGYVIPKDRTELTQSAVSSDGAFVSGFGNLAQELSIAIGITFLEKFSPAPRNSIALYDRYGKRVMLYAKVHTCDFGDESNLTPGEEFYTADLDTKAGKIKVGCMICYDREFPESARILMLQGAELILVPNACPMEINRISQLRGRAYENMLGIATCNYPNGKPDCNGHSTLFDGVAYLPHLSESRDTLILETGKEEGIYTADFDIDTLRNYRSCEVHGDAYRRPKKYSLLTEEKRQKPFLRADYRG